MRLKRAKEKRGNEKSFPRLNEPAGKGFSFTGKKQEKLFHLFEGTVHDFRFRFENLQTETGVQFIERIRNLCGFHTGAKGERTGKRSHAVNHA